MSAPDRDDAALHTDGDTVGLLFEQILEHAGIEVEATLDALALSPEDGRRIVTRELRYEPGRLSPVTLSAV